MTIVSQAVNQASSSLRQRATQTHGTEGTNKKELGKQDFLNLMMTQLAHQDPLYPMDSNKMMQQMTSMGTVEQLQGMNKKMDNLLAIQGDSVTSSAYSFLDKDVRVSSSFLNMKQGQSVEGVYSLNGEADSVKVQIANDQGEVIRVLDLGLQKQGTHTFTWDGKDDAGDALSAGTYRYSINARTSTGEVIEAQQYKQGRVSSIYFDHGKPMVEISGERFPLSQIQGLDNQTNKKFAHAAPFPLKTDLQPKPMVPVQSDPASVNNQ